MTKYLLSQWPESRDLNALFRKVNDLGLAGQQIVDIEHSSGDAGQTYYCFETRPVLPVLDSIALLCESFLRDYDHEQRNRLIALLDEYHRIKNGLP